MNLEAVQVIVRPLEADLEHLVEISDRAVATHQQPPTRAGLRPRSTTPELEFVPLSPVPEDNADEAGAISARCVCRLECLAYALAASTVLGL